MKALFDNTPVTEQDIKLWLDRLPNLSHLESRRQAYRKAYAIEEKIRAAKQRGEWPLTQGSKWRLYAGNLVAP